MKRSLLYLSLLCLSVVFSESYCNQNHGNYILVRGSTFTLELYDQYDHLVKSYPFGLGKNGLGKTKRGDIKTPRGEYKILWKASRFAATDGGYSIEEDRAFCGPKNIFTADPRIGLEDEQLWTEDYGGKEAVVMGLNYPNDEEVAKGYTGECIEIHASLHGGIGEYASGGCVRMLPADARDLYKHVDVEIKVIIQRN